LKVARSYGRFNFQTEGKAMPLHMDIHSLDGAVTFDDLGKKHIRPTCTPRADTTVCLRIFHHRYRIHFIDCRWPV
jgi:hypothetical protein